ncbi:MAG: hypothetical protein MPW15_14000 [Candidatus Manganitrophus sp.]|nr:hypothetical protein [Candidatus Manganitrophus sp.]
MIVEANHLDCFSRRGGGEVVNVDARAGVIEILSDQGVQPQTFKVAEDAKKPAQSKKIKKGDHVDLNLVLSRRRYPPDKGRGGAQQEGSSHEASRGRINIIPERTNRQNL